MNTPTDMLTTQGYDCQFGTNVVGPYLFTTLLVRSSLLFKSEAM